MTIVVPQIKIDQILGFMKARKLGAARNSLTSQYDVEGRGNNLAKFLLARCYSWLNQHNEALRYFQLIDADYLDTFQYWYLRGRSAYLAGNVEEAINSFLHAKSIKKNVAIVHVYLAVSFYKAQKFDKAANYFNLARSFCAVRPYLKNLQSLCDVRASDLAIQVSDDLNWPEAILIRGIQQAEDARDTEGAIILRQILANAPIEIWGYDGIGFHYCKFGEKNRPLGAITLRAVKNYLEEMDIADPHEGEYGREVALTLGRLFYTCRNYIKASIIFQFLIERVNLSLEDTHIAGKCLMRTNDYEYALQAYGQTILIDPDDSIAFVRSAKLYEALGNNENIIKCLIAQLNIKPRDISSLLWLANIYISKGEILLAERQLVKVQRLNNKVLEYKQACQRFLVTFGRTISAKSTIADYSYIEWNRIPVPEEFRYRPAETDVKSKSPRPSILKTMPAVISALILREMTSRFGRGGLGYLWVVIQQLVFISVLGIFFEFRGKSLPYGVSVLGFLITGINAYFIFRATKNQIKNAIKSNKALLYYRQVTPLSIYVARATLEISTGIVIFSLLVSIAYLMGENVNMTSLLQVIACLCMLGLFGTCYGLLVASITIYFPAFSSFENSIDRILFFTSGLFFYSNELPTDLRELLLWNPLFNLIELLREGFFSTYTAIYASMPYVAGWTLGLLFFALVIERTSRRRAMDP